LEDSIEPERIPAEILRSSSVDWGPSNPNGFRQRFYARATPRTPDKPGSAPTLRNLSFSLLYKNELGSTIGG
jgi:hypothetical protein